LAAPRANKKVGALSKDILRERDEQGNSPLGNLIADAQLEATRSSGKAQIALMNSGGVRADLLMKSKAGQGVISYEDLFRVQPFGNSLVTVTLTGEQLHKLLEMQWTGREDHPRFLYVSKGFSYAWDPSKEAGMRVDFKSIKLDGKPLERKTGYRVTVNSFLADGGDGFDLLTEGKERLGGALDLDALVGYVERNAPLKADKTVRVRMLKK
jgi:5'-nucleotidase